MPGSHDLHRRDFAEACGRSVHWPITTPERNHQGVSNRLIRAEQPAVPSHRAVERRVRLGGMLSFDTRMNIHGRRATPLRSKKRYLLWLRAAIAPEEEEKMIQIPQRSIALGGLTSEGVMDSTDAAPTTEAAPADPWGSADGAVNADPLAKFNAIFGAPAQLFYADKNGPSGRGGPAHLSPPATLGGPKAPLLQLGSSGPAVKTLQQELNKWRAAQSPKQAPIGDHGRFTPETKKAVEDFQKA